MMGNLPDQIPTESAVSYFGILAGGAGAVAQIVSSSRLSTLEGDTLPTSSLIIPLAVGAVATIAGAYMLPAGSGAGGIATLFGLIGGGSGTSNVSPTAMGA